MNINKINYYYCFRHLLLILLLVVNYLVLLLPSLLRLLLLLYYGHGPGSSSKALGYGLDSPCSIPGVGGVEISLHSFMSRLVLGPTQPHKMSTRRAFPRRPSVGLAFLPRPSAVAVYMWTHASTFPESLSGL